MRRRSTSSATSVPEVAPAPAANGNGNGNGNGARGDLSFLADRGVVSAADLDAARDQFRRTGRSVVDALVARGAADDRALAAAIGAGTGHPVVDLRDRRIEPAPAGWVGADRARRLDALAYAFDGGTVSLAVVDPTDERLDPLLAELRARGRLEVGVAPLEELRTAVNQTYRALVDVDGLVEQFARTDVRRFASPVDVTSDDQRDLPIVQLVERVLVQAALDRASDVHIEPIDGACRIRLRVDGALAELLRLPAHMAAPIVSRVKILADMSIVERRRPQDGQFSLDVEGRSLDVRVATSSTIWGEKAVLRLLGRDREVLRLADLGMAAADEARFARLVRSAHGMVVCSGPTGSGKTTTLYAAIGLISSPELNITTIEDPVESVLDGINQIQISEQAGLTFAVGLRSILRQDPDAILVGEMRDAETTRIAVEAALTGHLVLSSMHATDASSALVRMADMGIERFRIASSVIGAVGQRLVRRVCRACVVPQAPTSEELDAYRRLGGTDDVAFVAGEGCTLCNGTGFHGRVGVFEVLELDDGIRDLLVAGRPSRELRARAAASGMRTMSASAVDLVASGTTTIAEVLRKVAVH